MPFPAWLAMAIPPLINTIGGLIGQDRQADHNRGLAAYQHGQNMELLKYQLDYNSPAAQMGRFKDAGLNPNLVYGQGSPGNMESPPRYPDIKPTDMQSALMGIGTQFQQARLLSAQADLTSMKVDESGVKQDLMKSQKALTDANPFLEPGYVSSLVSNLESIARLKKQEADFMLSGQASTGATTQGQAKMMLDINRLAQQVGLQNQDAEIKANIIKSKEFQNALQEIQLKWMRDKEITPQHIYMGIMLLLQKMM